MIDSWDWLPIGWASVSMVNGYVLKTQRYGYTGKFHDAKLS